METLRRNALAVFALLATLACAVAASAEKPCLPEPLTWESWQALSSDARLETSATTQCRILKHLVEAFARLDERDLPNSQATDAQKPEAGDGELPLAAFVKTSEQAKRETCRLLAAIAAHVGDAATVLHALEVATLLEATGAGCLSEVVAATPPDVEDLAILETAYDLCRSRHEPGCEQLRDKQVK